MGWIASTHGQLFIVALENLIDQKIEEDKSSLKMRLYKHRSGCRVVLENGAEAYTLLDEKGLNSHYLKLGYKVSSQESCEKEIDIEIFWK